MILKITKKTENDKKNLIYIDNQIRGILPDRILLPLYPVPYTGEISAEQAKDLILLLEHQARQQLLKYLNDREHSSLECRQFLSRKMYPITIIEPLMEEFCAKKYIDDGRYVEILINSLISRKKSKREIMQKLKETRLPPELWEEALNKLYNPEEALENLTNQIIKLRLHYRELPKNKQKEKVFASLYRKGFNLDDIHTAWEVTKK